VSVQAPERQISFGRPPVTPEELWWTVGTMFGVWLPKVRVCPEHQAPFEAFCDAYFGNPFNWALWYGSRGTGKSYMLALLALTKAALLEVQVTLLGGSMAQSTNVHEHVESLMQAPNAPRHVVTGEKQSELTLAEGSNGGVTSWIRPLPASQKTVRGPHPHMTLLDEIDEMEKKVYDAAMGQALEKPNARGITVPEMVVASSTWQNPTGTFQEVIDEAREKGRPIFTWCYREVLEPNGWMNPDFINRKRDSVPAEMFRVEYELGEPAGDSRAFDLNKVNEFFIPGPLYGQPVTHTRNGTLETWVWEEPDLGGSYAAGADWAKQKDFTVIGVCRTDVTPRKLVKLIKVNRQSWPSMIAMFDDCVRDYHAQSAHDATGLGNVIHDLVKSERTLSVELIGKERSELLSEYIVDFEHGAYRLPRSWTDETGQIHDVPLFNAHKATTVDEVWGTARWDSHLPDEVAMMAILHRAAERAPLPAEAQGVSRSAEPPKSHAPLHTPTDEEPRLEGAVTRRDEDDSLALYEGGEWREHPVEDTGYGVFNL
jgi:hypothetical protein